MLFKAVRIYELTSSVNSSPANLAEKLQALEYKPCLPSMPSSMGWVPPLDEEGAPLARGLNGCIMMCLKIEEKILPASVIGDALKEKIKKIETNEARRVRAKEKIMHKEETIITLLPRAFSKHSLIYGYIDTQHGWLIINNTSPKKIELFLSMFKKSVGDIVEEIEINKPSATTTHWLKTNEYPDAFAIEKTCTMQDPNQQNRVIRCQQQDLFAPSIQSLIKDGCEVIQLGLTWHDRLSFVITEDFAIRTIRLAEDDLAEINDEIETKGQKFDADFIMMMEMFRGLFSDLLKIFAKDESIKQKLALTG